MCSYTVLTALHNKIRSSAAFNANDFTSAELQCIFAAPDVLYDTNAAFRSGAIAYFTEHFS